MISCCNRPENVREFVFFSRKISAISILILQCCRRNSQILWKIDLHRKPQRGVLIVSLRLYRVAKKPSIIGGPQWTACDIAKFWPMFYFFFFVLILSSSFVTKVSHKRHGSVRDFVNCFAPFWLKILRINFVWSYYPVFFSVVHAGRHSFPCCS